VADTNTNVVPGVDTVAIHCRACGTTMLAQIVQSVKLCAHPCPLCGIVGEFFVVDNRRVIRGVG
jgi:predicted RNA-binding Zn-ribbon protein involved in translation (DUF1610 family)